MNAQFTGKEFLDALASALSLWLAELLEAIFGANVRKPVVGEILWTDLAVFACFVLLAIVITRLAAFVLRRQLRKPEVPPEQAERRRLATFAAAKPLYLLIWVYAIYFAATPILLKLGTPEAPHPLRVILNQLFNFGVFASLFWLFFRCTHIIEDRLRAAASKSETRIDDLFVPLIGRSLRVVLPVIALILALPLLGLSAAYDAVIGKASSILIIAVVAWVLFQVVALGEKLVLKKYDISQADNLQARKVFTQVHVLGKTLYVLISIFTVASVLMLFEEVRRFGTSILASAGVLGIIIGFAAQRTIANLFAGFQIAMTQPIRIDDVVIVEGEWGRVEEITLTYVVVKIWDQRRLIVPLSYFIEKPFQNWTRVSADLLGAVFFYADYTLPLDQVRNEVKRIVENSPSWDRKFWNLQVTDTTDRVMQFRVLATADSSPNAWELRCEIREKLLSFIQQRFPDCLPKVRAELDGSASRLPPARTGPVPSSG